MANLDENRRLKFVEQEYLVKRSLDLAFNNLSHFNHHYKNGREIDCIFQGFPLDQFPDQHNQNQLARISKEELRQSRQKEDPKWSIQVSYNQNERANLVEIRLHTNVVRTWEGKKWINEGQESIRIEFRWLGEKWDEGFVCGKVELIEARLQAANKPCHPNPTALVGNLLTGGGNVIEVVKAR